MTRVAWFNCYCGIAGDMALGSLLDAGAELEYVQQQLGKLAISGWSVEPKKVDKSGLSATYANVKADDDLISRTWADIRTLLTNAPLQARVKTRSLEVFGALASAEASVHGSDIESIHFHEVGGVDAIVDIVGTSAALESLGVDAVYCSAVAIGTGTIDAAHGCLPNPGPATTKLLETAVITGTSLPYELTTPTGAAIVSALAVQFGAAPPMRLSASGFGAGTRDIEGISNCVQVLIGDAISREQIHDLTMLETNVDDVTGEVLGHTLNRLIESGANDAWITPILMKKGRAASCLSVLCEVNRAAELVALIKSETGSLGVRRWQVERYASDRRMDFVELEGQPVRIKVSDNRAKAEFEDALAVAASQNRPVREVLIEAEELWKRLQSK